MNFTQFKIQFQENPVIVSREVTRDSKDPQLLRNQLYRWQRRGLLIGLRKGVYLLNETDRKVNVDRNFVANILYGPSYLSLEYALYFYGLIPEVVSDFTSVTTRKTMRFKNALGNFIYQHIDSKGFRGFQRKADGKNSFFVAEPEKAVVDFLYLNLSRFKKNTRDVLEHSYRFQNIEELNQGRLKELGKLFTNKKLSRVIKDLCQWIDES